MVEKGEIAISQHFVLFSQCFASIQKQISVFHSQVIWKLFQCGQMKNVLFGEELIRT